MKLAQILRVPLTGWLPSLAGRHIRWIVLALAPLLALAAQAPSHPPQAAAQNAAGGLIYLKNSDQDIQSYDAATGQPVKLVYDRPLGDPDAVPSAVVAGPDGLVYVGTGSTIRRYDGATGNLVDTLSVGSQVISLAFAPDGTLYILGASLTVSQILRYDVREGRALGVVVNNITAPYPAPGVPRLVGPAQIEFGPTGTLYLLDTFANLLVRFDARTGEFLGTVIGPDRRIFYGSAFAVNPQGELFISEGLLPWLDNDPRRVFRYSRSGQFAGVFAEAPWPSGLLFGPGGDLFLTSNDSILRLDGRTGAVLGTVVAGPLGDGSSATTQLGPQSFAFAGTPRAAAPAARPAFVTVALRSSPALQASPGEIVTLTVTTTNSGRGGAKGVTVALPTDPTRLRVLDARFSSSHGWVSELRPDRLTLETGPLASGTTMTATLRLVVDTGAPAGDAFRGRPSYSWHDHAGGGSGVGNTLPLTVAAERRDAPFLPLTVLPTSAPAGSTRQYRLDHLLPGEPVALWLNSPGGATSELGRVKASPDGTVVGELPTTGLAPGWHSLVAQGLWSGLTLSGGFEVR